MSVCVRSYLSEFRLKALFCLYFRSDAGCRMCTCIIIRPNINIFILQKRFGDWRQFVRICVCMYVCMYVQSSSPPLHSGWQGCFFFFAPLQVTLKPGTTCSRHPQITGGSDGAARRWLWYIEVYGGSGGSRGNCLWTSSPGKLENADCPADGNEWQSCHAAFFLFFFPPFPSTHLYTHIYFFSSFFHCLLTRATLFFFLPPLPKHGGLLFSYIYVERQLSTVFHRQW